jgi:hypothetical protein
MSKPSTRPSPVSPQLQFPWLESPPHPRLPLPDAPHLHPAQLWPSLSPMLRTHVRTTLLQILEEVLHDHARS